jgi:hypothetical protein
MKAVGYILTLANFAYAHNETLYSIQEDEVEVEVNKENFFQASPLYSSLAVASLGLSLAVGSIMIYLRKKEKITERIQLEHPVMNENFEF